MGKRTSKTVSQAGGRRSAVVLAFLACLLIAGCAQRDSNSQDNRPGGFYGGMSVGKGM